MFFKSNKYIYCNLEYSGKNPHHDLKKWLKYTGVIEFFCTRMNQQSDSLSIEHEV